MVMIGHFQRVILVAAFACLMPSLVQAESAPSLSNDAAAPARRSLPGLKIHRDQGWVDLQAKVVGRDTDWLELLACSPESREHESILTTPARPSHIHMALLLLGLKPGHPMDWRERENPPEGGSPYVVQPPEGPRVAVTLIFERDGEPVEVDANRWILNQKTGKTLASNTWLFAGSRFEAYEGRRLYMADLNGTVISLVNFGDDLLARSTRATNRTDNQVWQAATRRIPPDGTSVTIRLRPMAPKGDQREKGATGRGADG